jgi:acetyltransferase-like isoleucine patch superfamily enzyme
VDTSELTGTWDYRTLPANVVLGEGCFLERRASFDRFRSTREPGLVLGERVKVYTWTAFNVEPSGRVTVGADSTLVGAVFMCAGDITIGQRVVVSYNVTIADCDFHPRNPDERMRDAVANAPGGDRSHRPPLVSKPVMIGDDVWVGIGAIILKGVKIGCGARVGPGAVVTSDVPDGGRVAGNPARPVERESWPDG